jgi:uncharacterized iron-regulated protein
MRRLVLAVLVIIATIAPTHAAEMFRVRDRTTIPIEKMLPDLRAADIIYIGEIHQVEAHRWLVLDIMRDLHAAAIPFALGVEMFRADEQATLDAWTGGTLSLERFIRAYADNWTLPWPLYDDIFLYAREHRIPLVGLSIPDEISAAVARGGFASLTEQQRKKLPPGMSCNVDPKYREFIRKAYGDHGGRSGMQFEYFCEAQMVWDKSMAWNLLRYRVANPGAKLVVLAGLRHAWRRGIPEQVALVMSGTASQVVLPVIVGQIAPQNVTSDDADFLFYW